MAKKRDYIGKHALYEKAKELASSEFFPNSRAVKYSAFNGLEYLKGDTSGGKFDFYTICSQLGGIWISIEKWQYLDDNPEYQYRVVEDVYSDFHNTGSFTYHSSHEYFRI